VIVISLGFKKLGLSLPSIVMDPNQGCSNKYYKMENGIASHINIHCRLSKQIKCSQINSHLNHIKVTINDN